MLPLSIRSRRPAALPPPFGPFAGISRAIARRWRLWRERARARRELRELGDDVLRDIGLTRAQARFDADRPMRCR